MTVVKTTLPSRPGQMLHDMPCGLRYLVQRTGRWMRRYTALVALTASVSLLYWALHSSTGHHEVLKDDPEANSMMTPHGAIHTEAFSRKIQDMDISSAQRKPSVNGYYSVPAELGQNVEHNGAFPKMSKNLKMTLNISFKQSPNVSLRQKQAPGANHQSATQMKLVSNGKERENGTSAVKVLLLAYFRTGSSFTAELLQQTEAAFYTFEPLHALYSHYARKSLAPNLLNGTKWSRILEGYQIPYARHLLDSLLHCRISRVDRISVVAYSKKSVILSKFRQCIKKYKSSPKDINNVCARQLQEECRQAPIRVVKTIRTPMRLVRDLLESDPTLKVIHLLRDPRGHTRSWMRHDGEGDKPRDKIEAICNRIRADLETRYELEKLYPGTFKEVIYEALATRPMAVVRDLYNWLNVPIQQKVINWLVNSTRSQKDGNFMETFRKNSSETAYSWIKKVTFTHVNLVNYYCSDIIAHGQFPALKTEQELKEFQGIVYKISNSSYL